MKSHGKSKAVIAAVIFEVNSLQSSRFGDPKRLQKLAGYAIVANESGKHKGESRISYRDQKRLRFVLYEAALSLIGRNMEFKASYEYYRTRGENLLKKM